MNYGFKPPVLTEKDWHFGGATRIKGEKLTDGHWLPYVVVPEYQNKGFETSACTVFGTLNCLEILLKQKGLSLNFSDRFNAILSDIDPNSGGDPQRVIEDIRKSGVIPEFQLPFDNLIDTVEKFYSPKPLPPELLHLGDGMLDMYGFGHDWVQDDPESIKEALKYSPLGVSVVAWYEDMNGTYYFPEGIPHNHWCSLVDYVDGQYWVIFDSYENDIKHVRWNSRFVYVKRYAIGKPSDFQLSLMERIIKKCKEVLLLLLQQLKEKKTDVILPDESLPPPAVVPKYEWDTPEKARHSLRVICDEEGLTVQMKNQLCDTVRCESRFNPKVIHTNKDGTTDYGICQYNTHWYIGEGRPIPSIDVALNDPEFCVRVMCKQFKAGHARDWICYRQLMFEQKLISGGFEDGL